MAFAVYFNNHNVTALVESNTFGEIIMSVPDLPPGPYNVTVQNEDGISMAYVFEILNDNAEKDYDFSSTYTADAQARLLQQYKKEGYPPAEYATVNAAAKLIETIYTSGLQELENVLKTVVNRLNADLATEYLLDGIGQVVVQDRSGQDDPTYRVYLKGKIALNNSKGKPEDIFSMWRIFVPATEYTFEELPPRAISIQSNVGPASEHVDAVKEFMNATMPLGYRISEFVIFNPTTAFTFSDLGDETGGELTGFSDTGDLTTGGNLATLL